MTGSVGIREVAAHAGVSFGTVSNVLNRPDRVALPTRARVQLAMDELGFVRNESARHLASGHGRTFGLVVPNVANPFYTDVARGAEDAANAAGYIIVLCNSDDSVAKESRYLNTLHEQRARGVLITPVSATSPELARMRARGTAVVLLHPLSDEDESCSVAVDDVLGGRLAVDHLLALGHRRIAFLNGPVSMYQCAARLAGARAAVTAAGLHPDDVLVEITTPTLTPDDAIARVPRLLAVRPAFTAAFCANDLLALGLLQGLKRAGVAVPADFSVVGYDDIYFASASGLSLTSVRQPRKELGRRAATLLVEECEAPDAHRHQHVVFTPELIVRETTAPTQ